MRKITNLFVVLTLLFSACTQLTPKKAVIKGKVDQPNSEIHFKYIKKNYAEAKGEDYIAKADSLGQFSIEIPVEQMVSGVMFYGKMETRLVLNPAYDLNVCIENDEFQFEGKGGNENDFLYVKGNTQGCSTMDVMMNCYTKDLSMDEMIALTNSMKAKSDSLLADYQTKKKLDPEFVKYTQINSKMDYLYCLGALPMVEARKKRLPMSKVNIPDLIKEKVNLKNIIDDQNVCSDNYLYTLNSVIRKKVMAICKKDSTLQLNDVRWKFITDSLPALTREYCIVDKIYNDLALSDHYDTLQINYFKQMSPSSNSLEVIDAAIQKYENKKALINAPLHADFLHTQLCDTSGMDMEFADVMKQHKGKVLYLDIWSLGCGPCRMAMPYSKQMKDSLKNEDIEFLYLTLDSGDTPKESKKIWEKVYQVTQTHHNQFNLKAGFNAKLLKLFNIYYVPSYMIIDKKGNLISYNADRPVSNGKYNEKLAKELIELARQ